MSNYTFTIGGSSKDLGIIRHVQEVLISNKEVYQSFVDGEIPQTLKMMESYNQYILSGIYSGSEANIKTFKDTWKNAEKNNSQVIMTTRFSEVINCIVMGIDISDEGGRPLVIEYKLTLIEGEPVI